MHDLKRAADTQPRAAKCRQPIDRFALEQYLAFARCQRAADQTDQRRLAGAVRADQTQNLALRQRKADMIDCRQPGKMPVASRTSSRALIDGSP